MSLTPIKLIRNVSLRNKLLKIKRETAEIDKNDYIESRMTTNAKARNLMAIEDASEIAKSYLLKKNFFVRFGEDIKRNRAKISNFHFARPLRWNESAHRLMEPLVSSIF